MDYKKYGWRRYGFYAFGVFAFSALVATVYFPDAVAWWAALWVLAGAAWLLTPKQMHKEIQDEERNRTAYRGW